MNARYLFGLPPVTIKVKSIETEFILDTGFNGALLLPLNKIKELGLKSFAFTKYALADGSHVTSEVFEAEVELFGQTKNVAVIGTYSEFSLLGMELLKLAKTTLSPSKNVLKIEPA